MDYLPRRFFFVCDCKKMFHNSFGRNENICQTSYRSNLKLKGLVDQTTKIVEQNLEEF